MRGENFFLPLSKRIPFLWKISEGWTYCDIHHSSQAGAMVTMEEEARMIAEAVWRSRKRVILDLYRTGSLDDVMRIMETYGFRAS
jgi:hypothetical protein